ncbi:methyl-accepting chemotaxis protein [Paenibacillus marinisediminis]
MKNTSIIVKLTVVVAILTLAMNTIYTYRTYKEGKLHEETRLITAFEILQREINLEADNIKELDNALKEGGVEAYLKDQNVLRFTKVLSNMSHHGIIGNTYILSTHEVEKDGKKSNVLLAANDDMLKSGHKIGEPMERSEVAYQQYKAEGLGFSGEYETDSGQWMTIYSPIKSGNETVAIFVLDLNSGLISNGLDAMLKENVLVGIAVSVIFVGLIIWFIYAMMLPLKRLAKAAHLAAEGDLTVSVPVKTNDEIGRLSAGVNTMISHISDLVSNVKNTADDVTASAAQLGAIADETSNSSQQISVFMKNVTDGATTATQSTDESKVAMDEIAIGIQRIAESTYQVSTISDEAAEAAQMGLDKTRETKEQMDNINITVEESTNLTRSLSAKTSEMEQIVGIIANIAAQTNLLALNASIEAARAGEHGKGFGVVASEVRKLAEQTQASTEQIAETLQSFLQVTDQLSHSMEKSTASVEHGAKVVLASSESFQELWHHVVAVNEQIQEVSAVAQQMSAGSEEVAASVDNLAVLVGNSAVNAEEAANQASVQLNTIDSLIQSSTELREKMKQLQNEISVFKLK